MKFLKKYRERLANSLLSHPVRTGSLIVATLMALWGIVYFIITYIHIIGLICILIFLSLHYSGFLERLRLSRNCPRVNYEALGSVYRWIITQISGQTIPNLRFVKQQVVNQDADAEIHELIVMISAPSNQHHTLENLFSMHLVEVLKRDSLILLPHGGDINVLSAFFEDSTATIRIGISFNERGALRLQPRETDFFQKEDEPNDFEF